MDLAMTHQKVGDWDVLAFTGEIDLATAAQFERETTEYIGQGCRLCLDLSKVSFMDSTGLRVLIGAYKQVDEADGRLHIVAGDGPVDKLLNITGLDERLDLYPSVAAATGS